MTTMHMTEEHMGTDATRAEAEHMVELLRDRGYDIAYGTGPGSLNDIQDDVWQECLQRVAAATAARAMRAIPSEARAEASRQNGRKGGRPSNFRRALEAALRGEKSECLIYWDDADPKNEGAAYRYRCESGALELEGWVDSNGPVGPADSQMHHGGYELWSYFGDDGRYLGPDKYGVRPVLVPD